MTATLSPSDLGELKTKQQATWASGNYAVIGTTLQIIGEELCEAVDIAAGSQVLDVAAGNGNASLAAARRGAYVTTTDYVDTLLGLSPSAAPRPTACASRRRSPTPRTCRSTTIRSTPCSRPSV